MLGGSIQPWLVPAMFFLRLCFVAAFAEFRHGDVVPMSYRTEQILSTSDEVLETSWFDALRSQAPRFGRPSTVSFEPALFPDVDASEDKLKIALAFSHGQFVVPRAVVRDKEGLERLERLVVTFSYEGGTIVRVRSEPSITRAGVGSDRGGFDVEYRWDRMPEEDEDAGISLLFFISLVVTVFLGVYACGVYEEEDGEGGGSGRGDRSRAPSGRGGGAGRAREDRRRR